MKKLFGLAVTGAAALSLASCGGPNYKGSGDDLIVYFVPSRDSAAIDEATGPLEVLLKSEMSKYGYDFKNVKVSVGSSYEAVGTALGAGSADIGFIPGGTYVLYADQGVDVALTATRGALSKDFEDAKSWNDGQPTVYNETEQASYYRSLIVAGPSQKGKELQAKVNAGTELTWSDVNSATWCVASTSSSAGYIYPTLWLIDNFDGKSINDLDNAIPVTTGYGAMLDSLAADNCDITTMYADARMDYAEGWLDKNGTSIWTDTGVIGVTEGIYNDTISISTDTVDSDLKEAIQDAFISLAQTEEGAEIFAIYNHTGYVKAVDSDYDAARAAQQVIMDLNA